MGMNKVKKLENLPPKARLKKLQELKERRQKEIEEAEEMIEESLVAIKNSSKLRQFRAWTASQLFTAEEQKMFMASRLESESLQASELGEGGELERKAIIEAESEVAERGKMVAPLMPKYTLAMEIFTPVRAYSRGTSTQIEVEYEKPYESHVVTRVTGLPERKGYEKESVTGMTYEIQRDLSSKSRSY